MKIVFVVEHYYPYLGGAEKLFRQLAEAFSKLGQEVVVVTTRHDTALPTSENINGVAIQRINCQSRFLFTLFAIPAVWKACKDADQVITTTYNAALPAWIVSKIRGISSLLIFHELWGRLWFSLPYLSWWQRWAYFGFEWGISKLSFDRYVAVSDYTRTALVQAGIPANRIHLIHNGIDYHYFENFQHIPSKTGFELLYFGRLGVSKGLNLLLPAWASFVQNHPEANLRLVIPKYPAKLFEQICSEIQALELSDDQLQLSHELTATELFELVASASAVVIPSYSEGFCFVAVETMAIGTPIISSGKGALKEVVGGRYLEMTDQSAESLTECLKEAQAGQWQKRAKQEFSLQQAIDQYISLIIKSSK